MDPLRASGLIRSRNAMSITLSCARSLTSQQSWYFRHIPLVQQRTRSESLFNLSGESRADILLDTKQNQKSDKSEHPLSDMDVRHKQSETEQIRSVFNEWKLKKVAGHSREELGEMLSASPPRSHARRSIPFNSASMDASSIVFPDSTTNAQAPTTQRHRLGGFSNPYASQRTVETPLERWKGDVEAMDKSLHLGLKTGRQMDVIQTNASDLGGKINLLTALVTRNNIRGDERQQRFHERPGLKRKRLKRERWRKRFSASFASICQRATSLARQGW